MNNLYLVRHGKKETISGDPKLTDEGKKQAELTGIYFKSKNIKVIYTSNYIRTVETAEIINKHLNVEVIMDTRLRERANWGDLKMQDFKEFCDEWYESSKDRKIAKHNRFSSFDTGENVRKMLIEVDSKYKNQNIIFVSHGGAIADFLRNVFGDEYMSQFLTKDVYLLDSSVSECSITHVTIDENKFNLLSFADLAHLQISKN